MALTNKLIADYVELINNQLDHIPVSNIADFDSIQEALSNIINPIVGYSVPERLRDNIVSVSEIFNFPEDYVESENDYNEFKNIIHTRINAKIAEFLAFNQEQKMAYLSEHQQRRHDAVQSQQQIRLIEPREPNILSENEWLADEQERFNQSVVRGSRARNPYALFRAPSPERRPSLNQDWSYLMSRFRASRESLVPLHFELNDLVMIANRSSRSNFRS